MNTEYDVWLGLDVGKTSHHGCGLGPAGERVFDHELPQDEAALREGLMQGSVTLIMEVSSRPRV